MKDIILASSSPRRKDIMDLTGINYRIESKEIDETFDKSIDIIKNLKNLSKKKALAIACDNKDSIVIGADTIVVIDDLILGKPSNIDDAKRMLNLISGRKHAVYTGVSVICINKKISISFVEKTYVNIADFSDDDIDWYISSKEPFGKAGAYAIQGKGSIFVESIEGDYYNVVGLPINKLFKILKKLI